MVLRPGSHLGPYKILSPLGHGGMGEVYRANDARLGRDVAIKVLPDDLTKNPDALRRFEREGKALAALSHPNILTVFDVGNDQGISFVVMELLEGETLRAYMGHSALSWKKVVDISIPIAEGLSAAHSKRIIHRDLKPENVILTSDGRIKILDFGLARYAPMMPQQDLTEAPTKSRELESVTVSGTIPYMSPEQVSGKSVDARSDIFSFGCMIYEMVTGTRPFARESAAETIAAILKESPAGLLESKNQIPPALDQLVTHCLEKKAENRFQSASDLTFALKSLSQESGIAKTAPVFRVQRAPVRLTVLIAVVALFIAAVLSYSFRKPEKVAINSLAILPFANAGANPEMEYLSDGITDTLINNLSQVPKLRVMAHGTVFSYKGKDVDPRKAGKDLRVNAVVTGSIQQRGDTLIIRADLVNVADGMQLWGHSYNRGLSDILLVQEEISREIGNKLRFKLTGEEEKRLTKHYTENTEAYHLYLRGRYHWNRFTEEDLKKSIEYFNQAIGKDPSYALAYVGLQNSYAVLGIQYWPPKEAWPKAKAAGLKAQQIDENLDDNGAAYLFYDWDWASARKKLVRSIEKNPNNAEAHELYSYYFEATGRPLDAIAEMERAMELDPLSLVINADLAVAFNFARQYDRAIQQFQKTIELEPNWGYAHAVLGSVYLQKGMQEEAIHEMEKAEQLDSGAEVLGRVGNAYAVSGNRKEAERVLEKLSELSKTKYIPPFGAAFIHIGLGNKDQAFQWLERAYQERSGWLIWINDPIFDPVRDDPRYADLLRRMGLPL